MRWLLTLPLLTLAAGHAAAEQNEAEKLFHTMEEKVHAAKTLQVRFDLDITDALGKKGNVKGALILGEGDKYRAEVEGKLFGQAVKGVDVSDGANRKLAGDPPPPDTAAASPKGAGAYFRAALPREGFFLGSLEMERRNDRPPDQFQLSDFRLANKEKIGERDAQAIQYTMRFKGAGDPLSMKLWLDAETNLPVKLAVTGGKSDWKDLTETYGEFTIDADVDAKSFELPK
jgi:outer membrane lipoprotein-sorting protein